MKRTKLSKQIKAHSEKKLEKRPGHDGDTTATISTGSTLLDLAICGSRIRGGGIPAGIMIEISGESNTGKTVMLCEIAGAVQRQGGQVMFRDTEGRLDKHFSRLFGLNPDKIDYDMPDTVREIFEPIRKWEPEPEGVIHGAFVDSIAAISTEREMRSEEDKMGGTHRAKELSEQCRKTCRVIKSRNHIVVCANQLRENVGAGAFAPKTTTPGGKGVGYHSSLRLKMRITKKLTKERKVKGRDVKRIVGIETEIVVFKSSVDKPYRTAPVTIMFDYGIDDIRQNLQFIKRFSGEKVYTVCGEKVGNSLDRAIEQVEQQGLENDLREEVIDLWEEIESAFKEERKPKVR